MAIDTQALASAVRLALVLSARDWEKAQSRCIEAEINSQPILQFASPMFRASAWLNIGLDVTVALFPAVTTLAHKLTVPLAVANAAMGGFKTLYENNLTRIDAVVSGGQVLHS